MKNNSLVSIKDYLELGKLKIMLPVSLTGFTGYFVYNPHISFSLFLVSLGILFLAVAASVLNQLQEIGIDSKMERTQNRPIPAHRIKVPRAIFFFFSNLIAGITIIYIWGNLNAALIALFTIFWYNVIYTYSKRITAFAVVPGALTGALPPLIGWVAAGGGMWDKPIVFIEFLLFTGQIPHFWLLILKYGEEYKKAGIPSLTEVLSRTQISRLTFTWVVTSVIAAIFLCYFEIFHSLPVIGILLAGSAVVIWQFFGLINSEVPKRTHKRYTILLDSYFLLVLLLLIADRIVS